MIMHKLALGIGVGIVAMSSLACSGAASVTGRVPAVAFKAPAMDDASPCHVGGSALVSDAPASVAAGLRVVDEGGALRVAFTTVADATHTTADPRAFRRETADAPMRVARPGGVLLVWTEPSPDDGYVVRAQAADPSGAPVGERFTVSASTFAVAGRPVASILEDGTGIVGYFSDDGSSFHAVSTRLSCRAM